MVPRSFYRLFSLVSLAAVLIGVSAPQQATTQAISVQPIATLDQPSPAAQKALAFLAQRERIPLEELVVVSEFRREALPLKRSFQAVTLVHNRPNGRFYHLLVDRQTGTVENLETIEQAEQQASRAKYGKLQPELAERLQTMSDTDTATVMIWAADRPGLNRRAREEAAIAKLAAEYPQARAAVARSGKPMDVDDPELARKIAAEYSTLVNASAAPLAQALAQQLRSVGAQPRTYAGLPAVTMTLTKAAIVQLARRADVGALALDEGQWRTLNINTATATNRVRAVKSRGYDGTGASIAIFEPDSVDFDDVSAGGLCPAGTHNCFRNPGAFRLGLDGIGDHATLVASAAASNNATYPGMAPGATLVSAGVTADTLSSGIQTLTWAWQQGADILNASVGTCPSLTSRNMTTFDWAFDYSARLNNKLIVVAAGNKDPTCPVSFVDSPGKGWNVLTVGAYGDGGDASWATNDFMAGFSAWQNPTSPNNDREKPEVVAPGVAIDTIGRNGNYITNINGEPISGTSIAVPQVAGLAALLIHRNNQLRSWPEAQRAIIMATATHNIDSAVGPDPSIDDLDGAGGINADLADLAASTRGAMPSTNSNPCISACWWGESITSSSFDASGYRYYYFRGRAGDKIRLALSWWSNASCPDPATNCSFDRLDTNLNMGVQDPNGNWVTNAWAGSLDNNYEVLPSVNDIVLPVDGVYRIAVYKQQMNESTNSIGLAWTKVPAPAGTYDVQHHAAAGPVTFIPPGGVNSGWGSLTGVANAAWNTLTYTGNSSYRGVFSFNGTRISFLYPMGTNAGNQTVFIDGENKGSFSSYAGESRPQVIRTWDGLPSGDHTIEVRADGGGFMNLDAFAVDQVSVGAGTYDDQGSGAAIIRFIGSWDALTGITTPSPGAYNGTMRRSRTHGDVMRLTFVGNQITWVYSTDLSRGIAAVTIDGVHRGYYNLFGPLQRQQKLVFSGLGNGVHTFHITVTGQTSCSGQTYCDTYVDVDALIVQ
jgi:hypothetical protein